MGLKRGFNFLHLEIPKILKQSHCNKIALGTEPMTLLLQDWTLMKHAMNAVKE